MCCVWHLVYNPCTLNAHARRVGDVEEREFFAKIKQAVFSNLFGQERQNVDLELSGLSADSSNAVVLATLLERVAEHLDFSWAMESCCMPVVG